MRPGRERGAAAIWVLVCGTVLVAVALAVAAHTLGVLARHRAESAADLAALAAATRIGVGGDPCAAASAVATSNGAVVVRCDVALAAGGRSGTVVVRVRAHVELPLVGTADVSAGARAARLPYQALSDRDEGTGNGRRTPVSGLTTAVAVWHADAVRNHSNPG